MRNETVKAGSARGRYPLRPGDKFCRRLVAIHFVQAFVASVGEDGRINIGEAHGAQPGFEGQHCLAALGGRVLLATTKLEDTRRS